MTSNLAQHQHAPFTPLSRRPGPVLVATTGSDGAAPLLVGRELAAHLGTPLRLVSVLEVESVYLIGLDAGPLVTDFETERRRDREALVRRRCEEVLGLDPRGGAIRVDVRAGEVARTVRDVAIEHGASLVVVGHTHRDLARRLLMGESALRISRRAPCPVLVAPTTLRVPAPRAVVGVDFSPAGLCAAREALRLLAPAGELHLVHVWPRLSERDRWLREQDERYAQALPARLARFVEVLRAPAGVRVETAALVGDTVEALLAHADRVEATLVAVGRRGHGLMERLLLGSIATRVVRASPHPVLVTPEPSAIDALPLERALGRAVESDHAAAWPALLDDVVQRNRGRATVLEESSARPGAHVEASGYALLDASFDPHGARVLLMFGESAGERVLTHSVRDVRHLSTTHDADGRDRSLRVVHGGGTTRLTFVPE